MNYYYHPEEMERVALARDSFSGRPLSDAQFDEAIAITGIIEREIKKNGAFKEKLADYAYAFSRTENFDVARAETIIRDLFKARTGKTMNQMREELMEREAKLTPAQKKLGHEFALATGAMIETGNKISFHRAYAHQGQALANELDITDAGAKRLMKEEFAAAENADFYEWGKHIEEEFYRPQIEAERREAEERREQNATRGQNRSRTNGRARGSSRDENGETADNGGTTRTRSYRTRDASQDAEGETRTASRPVQSRSRMQYSR